MAIPGRSDDQPTPCHRDRPHVGRDPGPAPRRARRGDHPGSGVRRPPPQARPLRAGPLGAGRTPAAGTVRRGRGPGPRRPGVLGTLLHEGAHGLASVRKVQDTSRQGRFHNARYNALAEEARHHVARQPRSGGAPPRCPMPRRRCTGPSPPPGHGPGGLAPRRGRRPRGAGDTTTAWPPAAAAAAGSGWPTRSSRRVRSPAACAAATSNPPARRSTGGGTPPASRRADAAWPPRSESERVEIGAERGVNDVLRALSGLLYGRGQTRVILGDDPDSEGVRDPGPGVGRRGVLPGQPSC